MEQLTTQGHLALAAVTILELGVTSIRTRDVYDVYTSFQITLTLTAWLNVGCVIISSSPRHAEYHSCAGNLPRSVGGEA